MRKLIVATAAALLLGAPVAFAANTTASTTTTTTPTTSTTTSKPATKPVANLSEKCTSLGSQFDKVEMEHKSDKNYKQALSLRSEGKSLCSSHKQSMGIKKIESALTMIGVKPKVKS
ncbi:MAG TPA: hypothetical protein VLB05_08055 [Dongiaceae bacterium]|jgi:hypothetical protein|nr:hypothetical protein [Dongiaceae bacterium]